MTACTDACKHDIPVQKPSLFASKTVQAFALSWIFAVGGLVAGTFPDQQTLVTALLAAEIGRGRFYFAREAEGGSILETLGRLRAVAHDKTGTITWGKPSVTASGVSSDGG